MDERRCRHDMMMPQLRRHRRNGGSICAMDGWMDERRCRHDMMMPQLRRHRRHGGSICAIDGWMSSVADTI